MELNRKKKILLYSLVLFIIIEGMNLLYVYFFIPKKVNEITLRQYEDSKDDYSILFFGDSHVKFGINPEFIDRSFNLANEGETYEQSYYRIQSLLSENSNIRTLVLPIDYHSFSRYRINEYNDIYYWSKYLTDHDLEKLTGKNYFSIIIQKLLPFIAQGDQVLTYYIKRNKTQVKKGWRKVVGDFSKNRFKDDSASKKIQIHFNGFTGFDDTLYFSFLKIVKYCMENRIKIILIKMPVTENYITQLEHVEYDWNGFYNSIDDLIRENGLILFDYQRFITDNSFFSDSDHLNYKGAEILSKRINLDIKSQCHLISVGN